MTLTDEIDRKILSIFTIGMSYLNINKQVEDMYFINVLSDTDKIISGALDHY
ncbi:hypothetical protein HQQ94_00055 [Shewanella sp. VB17]|nr:hypothetical protein [Shewanella sp. VB17]